MRSSQLLSGQVVLAGTTLASQSPEARAAIGLGHVPEGRGILTSLTVEENLGLGMILRHDKAEAAKDRVELLELFQPLGPKLRDLAGSLSGGQQQMLSLARALLARPRLLMIDEMSFGLSPMLVNQLFQLVVDLRERTTFLLVEQNADALKISDRTYVVSGGRTVLESPSCDLIGNDRLVRSYLGAGDGAVSA